jgi:hypothetical protein
MFFGQNARGNFLLVNAHLKKKVCPLIYGGSAYNEHLEDKIYRQYVWLEEQNKTKEILLHRLDDKKVNEEERKITAIAKNKKGFSDLDDAHILAILIVSKCKCACTHDKRSTKFLTHDVFFSCDKPKIILERTPEREVRKILQQHACKKIGKKKKRNR